MRTYEIGIGAFSAASPVVKQSLITRFIERIDRSSFRESGWMSPLFHRLKGSDMSDKNSIPQVILRS